VGKLEDLDQYVRKVAVETLGARQARAGRAGTEHLEHVKLRLNDDDEDVRRAALYAMREADARDGERHAAQTTDSHYTHEICIAGLRHRGVVCCVAQITLENCRVRTANLAPCVRPES
jgi:hypothetical protein